MQEKTDNHLAPDRAGKQLKCRPVENICGLTIQVNRAGRRETEEAQFHFPVTPLTWIKVGTEEDICKNNSMQTSEGRAVPI